MTLRIDPEWLRRKILECDEPEGCPYCGAIAGACSNYPNCPGGAQQGEASMTTTVRVLIEGNKACEVKVEGQGTADTATIVKPGSFTLKNIHGDQTVSVKETGDFVS